MTKLTELIFDISMWLANLLYVPETTRFYFFIAIAALIWLNLIYATIALVGGGIFLIYLAVT